MEENMDSNSIMNKTFTMKMGNYAKDEVDEYLQDMAREFSQLKKEEKPGRSPAGMILTND